MVTTQLYTAEGAESARQSEHDKSVPDPSPEQAKAAIESNTLDASYICAKCRRTVTEAFLLTDHTTVCNDCYSQGSEAHGD